VKCVNCRLLDGINHGFNQITNIMAISFGEAWHCQAFIVIVLLLPVVPHPGSL